jgi:hypothetical protein
MWYDQLRTVARRAQTLLGYIAAQGAGGAHRGAAVLA